MNSFWIWLLLTVPFAASSEHFVPTAAQASGGAMLAAVSRDARMLGMGSGKGAATGATFVEPFARLTSSGEWQSLACFADRDGKRYDENQRAACLKFEREYLSEPHSYTVVSAEGRGATISAAPTTLGDCFEYTEKGAYSGANMEGPAVAASSTDFFSDGPAPELLHNAAATPILKAFAASVPGRLDSSLNLKIFSLRLEGQDLALVQRSHAEPGGKSLKPVFAIGTVDQGQFHLVHWKQNTGDEDEVVLGAVHLKNGRGFLITVVSDSEGQWFRIYGIRQGKLAMVFSGGGSSC